MECREKESDKMSVGCRLEPYLEKISKTITGRTAHFEIVTLDSLKKLKQDEFILTTNGIIEDGITYRFEFGTFNSVVKREDNFIYIMKQKGILNFAKEELEAYRPSLLIYQETPYVRRMFTEPQFRSIYDFYHFNELIEQKVTLRMVYDEV